MSVGLSLLLLQVFDLNSDLTPNGFEIFSAAKMLSPNIAYFLPRHTSIKQVFFNVANKFLVRNLFYLNEVGRTLSFESSMGCFFFQLISLAGKGGSCEIEHSLLNKKIKSITAYYGDLVLK